MEIFQGQDALDPVTAFALVGVLGVGAQLLAWRIRIPAIVLMLLVGVLAGPVFGIFDPARDIGALRGPLISVAVAIILFEGGLTLNVKSLRDSAQGVVRLVVIGAPLGWLLSSLALHYGAGLGWESSAVFGGIMIVTGPTVIAPLLRSARLKRRPAQILQWEAIINDPIGALAAVLAFEVIVVVNAQDGFAAALWHMVGGIGLACLVGFAAGRVLVLAFHRGRVPEFMKVGVLFVALLSVFALADSFLHESGLLAVTVMGIVIANSNLPSFVELRRFKEHATLLLVSGVFILLAAGLDVREMSGLTWRAVFFVALVMFVARPVTVMVSLIGTGLPWRERVLVAFTGPRGVVLVAVAGLFGERLVSLGIEDGAYIAPLSFALVAASVVVHGFALRPMGRALGLASGETPGLLIVGGTRFTREFARTLQQYDIAVLLTDPNHGRLRHARSEGIPTFYGDILSEAAEHQLELAPYDTLLCATDNDAYNTLVATDLSNSFGRENVYQLAREKENRTRHALPASLGGRRFAQGLTYDELETRMREGWRFRSSRLTEEFPLERWREEHPSSTLIAAIRPNQPIQLLHTGERMKGETDTRLIHLAPPEDGVDVKARIRGDEEADPDKAAQKAEENAPAVKTGKNARRRNGQK